MRVRGFSLVELVIGATMVLFISTMAMVVLVAVQNAHRDAQAKQGLARDAELILDTIGEDVKFLGNGVPRGLVLTSGPGGPQTVNNAGSAQLRPPLRAAEPDAFAFVGDLPYPNADFTGVAMLGDIVDAIPTDGDFETLIVTSELSGCAPKRTAGATYVCNSEQRTMVDIAATFSDRCTDAAMGARTCPWGLGKWQPNSSGETTVVLTSPSGRWRRFQVEWSGGAVNDGSTSRVTGARLTNDVNNAKEDFVNSAAGAGAVAQIDRVFYSFESGIVYRRQCWGNFTNVSAADFPGAGSAALTTSDTPQACTPPEDGTNWEAVADGISVFNVTYLQDRTSPGTLTPIGPSLTTLAQTAQVSAMTVTVEVSRTLPSPTPGGAPTVLKQRFTRTYWLENAGGIYDPRPDLTNNQSAANGGCIYNVAPPSERPGCGNF
jgi:type II secretory pathway pseudopilin PulG